jgi:23S rRNA (adenine2503-C2)-methyltransferase
MKHLLDMTAEEFAAEMARLEQPKFRARQIGDWVWHRGVFDFAKMTNLPAAQRAGMAEQFSILSGKVMARADAADQVTKLLLAWPDGQQVETVLIPTAHHATACLSTQAGCAVGCSFCASGSQGLGRNLTGGEIVEQVLQLQAATGRKVTHAVFMGMGEPLANFEATLFAVRAIIDPGRLGISARHVTVSTVGLPKAIRNLAAQKLPITLAISLHAHNDALRRQLIPNAPADIESIVEAAEAFYESRHRELTLEYVLLAGVNDTNLCAEGLSRIARRLRCNVNIIRFNPAPGLPYQRPSGQATLRFAQRLEKAGVNVQIRKSRGAEADAACGQLRAKMGEQELQS